jgi:quercetin dioxygenase-like cupin family protein
LAQPLVKAIINDWSSSTILGKDHSMKAIRFTALALSAFAFAAVAHAKGTGTNATVIEAKDIQWKEMPGFPGVQLGVVEGDATKGNHHAFTKFAPGFSAPVHNHSPDHFVSVVSGTLILTVDGKEHRLPPGSYFSFKNKGMHATACAAGSECVIFADVRGKWDIVPAKPEKK